MPLPEGQHRGSRSIAILDVDDASAQILKADALYDSGVRRVRLRRAVDLSAPTTRDLRALDFVKMGTARGLQIQWAVATEMSCQDRQALSHLQAPISVAGSGVPWLDEWRNGFFLGRCIWRQGPGFIQIRDRRSQRLVTFNLTDPEYLAAFYALDRGEPYDLPAHVTTDLLNEGLVLQYADMLWLAPYQIVRWPFPSMTI